MDVAELGWRSNTKPLKDTAVELRNIRTEGRGAAGANDAYNDSADRAARGTDRFGGSLGRLGGIMGSVKSQIVGFGAGMVAAFGFQAVIGSALEFSQKIGELSTIASEGLEEMTQAAKDMAAEFGGSSTTQASAFYQAISAGGAAAATSADAIQLLEVANRVAIGGAAQLTSVVDILASSLNAYADVGLTAADAADILFVGANAGQTSIEQLASGLGRVIPAATALDVSFEQLVAAVSSLTAVGQSTDVAITGVGQALSQVLSPTAEAAELARQLGLDFSAAALKAKGFSQFMLDVTRATGGSEQQLAALFGSVQAMRAVFALTGNAAGIFADTLDNMATRAGAADTAFDLMSQTLSQRFKVVMSEIGAIALDFGTILLNTITPALELITDNIGFVAAALVILSARFVAAGVAATGAWVVGIIRSLEVMAIRAAVVSGGLGVMTARTIAATVAMRGLSVAMAFIGGPIGLAFLAIAGTVALLIGGSNDARAATEQYSAAVQTLKERYDAAGQSAAVLTRLEYERLLVSTRVEADAARAAYNAEASALRINESLMAIGSAVRNNGITSEIRALGDAFVNNRISVEYFANELTRLAAIDPTLGPWANEVNSIIQPMIDAKIKANELGITVANLEAQIANVGTATGPAAAGVASFGNTAGAIIPNLDAAAAATNRLISALRTLNAIGVPALDDRGNAAAQFNAATNALNDEATARGLTTEQMIEDTDYLNRSQAIYRDYQAALTRIATDEAGQRAASIMAIENEAYLGGLEGRERAVEEEHQRYNQQLADLIALGAGAEEFNRVTAAHLGILENIETQYAEVGAAGGAAGGTISAAMEKAAEDTARLKEEAEEAAKVLRDIGEDMRKNIVDAFKGFFQDLRSGKGILDSFANALDKVVGKIFDLWLNKIFSGFLAGPVAGGPIIGFFKSLIGLQEGGYTGNGGTSEVAGVVHGREFVVNAAATAKNRPLLEAMNDNGGAGGSFLRRIMDRYSARRDEMRGGGFSGRPIGGSREAARVTVINNLGKEAQATVTEDENGDIMIMLDRAAEQLINKPGSRMAKALRGNYGAPKMGTR